MRGAMEMPQQGPPRPDTFPLLEKTINGAVAGCAGLSIVFPLDLVKTRLQSQQLGPNGELMYKNLFDCFMKTYRAEGFLGMYRGIGICLLLISPEKSLKLIVNDFCRHHFVLEDGSLPMLNQIAAAGCAGVAQISISTPAELMKIQLQNAGRVRAKAIREGKSYTMPTLPYVVRMLVKEKGVLGMYRGIAPTACRDIIFSMIYFPMFAYINYNGPLRPDGEAASYWSFVAGMIAGSVSAVSVTPFDVVKTRLQAIERIQGEREFTGIVDGFRKTFHNEGLKALFKGGFCRIIVIAPLNAIAQAVYYLGVGEAIVNYFR